MKSFAARLIDWQRMHGRRDLPWQNTRDAYRIWVSEIMLQQTQVATVIPYYQRFIAEFPSASALAAAPLDRVLQFWSGLGYYRRAHLLHRAAQIVVAEHGGILPRDPITMATLPGIGRSTGAAIATLAYGARQAILDGNVKRVLARHEGIDGYPGDSVVSRALWARAEALLPSRDVAIYTQGLMDLGSALCTRAAPRCPVCPIAEDCSAKRSGRVGELPAPRPSKLLPQRSIKLLIIERAGEVLLERRPSVGVWAGLWSLPEVNVDADAVRDCRKRFGGEIALLQALPVMQHVFTHFRLSMTPQPCAVRQWPSHAEEPGLVWLPFTDVGGAALPAPIKKLLRTVGEGTLAR